MHYKNPYLNEWKVKGRPGFLEIFACVLKKDNRIDDYDFFQKLFISFNFPYTFNNNEIQFLLSILERSDNIDIVKTVIELFHQYILHNEKNKQIMFSNGLLDACIFRLLNKDTDTYFIELFDLVQTANIPNELTKLQCLIFSKIFETCFDVYRNDSNKINKTFECFNTFLESEFFIYSFSKEYSIYPLLKFLNPLHKGISSETITLVLEAVNSMTKYRPILEDLAKTPIIKFLLNQILNKNLDVTKASYQLLLRLSNNDTLLNDFLKEWGSIHVSSVIKSKNINLLYPVALLVKKLLTRGKLKKNNDNINSEAILKNFNDLREVKRKETGNNTDYNIVPKNFENRILEFHPVVYTLDNIEGPIYIKEDEYYKSSDEDENDYTELLSSDNPIQGEKEIIDETSKEIKLPLVEEILDLEKLEKEKEDLTEKHREDMFKKYDFKKNEKVVTYDEINVDIDDEYNKMNTINEDIKLDNNNTNFNEKILQLRNKMLTTEKKENKNDEKESISVSNSIKKGKGDLREIINKIPENINSEIYYKNLNKYENFIKNKIIKKKNDNKTRNDFYNYKNIQQNRVNSMFEKQENEYSTNLSENLISSTNNIDDYILNNSFINLINDFNNDIDEKDYISVNKIENGIDSDSEKNKIRKPITIFNSRKSDETIVSIIDKIQNLLTTINLKEEDIININNFLNEIEFKTNKIDDNDDIGYIVNKEILYNFYNNLKELKAAYDNNEDIEKYSLKKFGGNLSRVNFLDIYKNKLTNELYNSDSMTNIELSLLGYLTNQKDKNKEYKTKRSMILDLFEVDSDNISDDLYNDCISTLKYNINKNKKKYSKNIQLTKNGKKSKNKLLKMKATEKKINSIKNKQKRIYEEYQNGLQKRKPQKESIKKKNSDLEKIFSDINLEKDLKPIDNMSDNYLREKLEEYGSDIFKSQTIKSKSLQEISRNESNIEIISINNEQESMDDNVDNNILKALEKFNSYNEKLNNIDFITLSILNELKNAKLFHEKISILCKLQELSLFKKNIADAYLFKLIDEILNYIDNNDNKVILRLCYNIILNFIRNEKYRIIIGTKNNLFKYLNHGLQSYNTKIIEVCFIFINITIIIIIIIN
ncbi:hypothetical protein H8356DRAFT_1664806 [Neocallimastix lanati (nom. inval.)]|nr:hypothetical protein H8356DRAFT_1664806 [Neocallimastix sp. JGI-2020a]